MSNRKLSTLGAGDTVITSAQLDAAIKAAGAATVTTGTTRRTRPTTMLRDLGETAELS